jgi:hypothetical protein
MSGQVLLVFATKLPRLLELAYRIRTCIALHYPASLPFQKDVAPAAAPNGSERGKSQTFAP